MSFTLLSVINLASTIDGVKCMVGVVVALAASIRTMIVTTVLNFLNWLLVLSLNMVSTASKLLLPVGTVALTLLTASILALDSISLRFLGAISTGVLVVTMLTLLFTISVLVAVSACLTVSTVSTVGVSVLVRLSILGAITVGSSIDVVAALVTGIRFTVGTETTVATLSIV